MTSLPSDAPPASPWLSVWLRPRDTIERILAADPRRHVPMLAALGAVSLIVAQLIGAESTAYILDWRVIGILVLLGAAMGVVGLYVYAAFLRWSGRLIGGRATGVELRAVLAWSTVPTVIGLGVCLLALIGFRLAEGGSVPFPSALTMILQVVTMLLGLWSLIAMMLMLSRVQRFGFWRTLVNASLGWLAPPLVLSLIIRTFLFQPFNIPSGAMIPTLLIGDHLFVSKYSYGYTHYSLPLSPRLFSGRILASEPQRGDVVVFRLPKDDSTDYIKRIVGLPGDRIQMRGGVLYINGAPVKRERIEDFIDNANARVTSVKRWRETLPNGVSYETLDLQDNGFLDNTQEFRVPTGHYFMMGDNRDNSTDSRVLTQVGYVPFENIVGRAALLYFSIDRDAAKPAIRFERLGTMVR
jgi:signal peptidase I